jgi:serine/threonine protein kinase
MTQAGIQEFLAGFDESRFPRDFLQRYEAMECLSNNERGETLLVKDRQTGEFRVAKCYLKQAGFSPLSEGELLGKLNHTKLPKFTEAYENNSMVCILRTYVPGQSLDKLVQDGPFTKQQASDIIIQLCDVLTYLHEQTPAIIHRDIKPQNVILDESGKVTLIDFEISRVYNPESQEDTFCLGTRHYAAPEQYGFSQTDSRTDIFSLGILFHWLLTGNVDVRKIKNEIRDHRLVRIITKCTAFAPQDRYKKVCQVKDALTGRTLRRHIFLYALASLVILAGFILTARGTGFGLHNRDEISFEEPLIEEAVRLSLGKEAGEIITEQELSAITELYVFGNKAAADGKTYEIYVTGFATNTGSIERGSLDQLDDLERLSNLRKLSLAYQNITDVKPLAGLLYLEEVDLRHNPVEDVSPLSQSASLTSLTLFDTRVSNLTALSKCAHLSNLDIGFTKIRSITALDGLDSLRTLSVRRAPLQSLEHIGTHPLLEKIYLSETQLLDLSPLLELPRLESVEINEAMRQAAEAIKGQAQFNFIYQE